MKVLVACETSGVVRSAFRERGHNAWSCDILPADDRSNYHICGDVRHVLSFGWDLMIAHPPCTHLSSSGARWWKDKEAEQEAALAFVRLLMGAPILRIAVENPVGRISTTIRKPDQIIRPHQFGEDASKTTCLWLRNLPELVPTLHIPPRLVDGLPRWANQTDSGQNRLSPSPDRWKYRSRTYPGIAAAMAEQWGLLAKED